MNLQKIIDDYDPTIPLAEASTIPASWYLHPKIAELERRTVFSSSWQMAARLDQLQEAGDFVTCDVAGEPVVVVRGDDDRLRGFFNVCRHHAAAVAGECGRIDRLTCPYHGWTYSLQGRLESAPDLGAVRNFDRDAMGLAPVPIQAWKRWALVRIDQEGIAFPGLPDLDLSRFYWFERRRYTLNCNWKVFVDNYLDGGYHVPHLHKGLDSRLDYAEYHVEVSDRFSLQWSPLSGGGLALYYWVYPNLMVNVYPTAMDTNVVIPLSPGRTEVVFDFYFTDISDEARNRNLASVAVSEEIQNEDVGVCASVQRGLQSRAYFSGRLSATREAGMHLFHRLLHADLKRGIEKPESI